MIIKRRPPRHPRRGPSCLLVILVAAAFAVGAYIVGNADDVREAIIPTPTPEPTRSAAEYAASAALYQRDGEFENAIEAYEQAISLDATNVNFYMDLIELLTFTNQAEDALSRAEQAKVLASGNPQVWVSVAAAHLANGERLDETGDAVGAQLQYEQAVNAARQATELNPNLAEAYAYMARALVRLGPERYDEAVENAALGVELSPESATVRQAMANVFEMRGRYDEAIEEYLIALDSNPNLVDLRIDLAYLYFFTERRQQAILTLQDVVELDPENADAYDGLGYFYFILGQYPQAEENAFQAVQLDPEMTRAHAHLGAAYFQQSKYDTAIEELEIATEAYEKISTANAVYFNMLGRAYYRQDNCDLARPVFERVVNANPDEFSVSQALEGLETCRQEQLGSSP